MDEKFAVLKGVCGWGDRLQCLMQAIGYSRRTGRYLVIDWRDSDWTHDQNERVEKWFSIKGVRTTPLSEFLNLDTGKLSVFPPVWKSVLKSPEYQRWIYKPDFYNAADHDHIQKITRGFPDHEEQVVVCPGVGKRTFSYSDCNAIILAPWLAERISGFARENGLKRGRYDVVHLRGGSKSWAGGAVPLRSLDERIKKAWPTRESYLSDMESKYKTKIGSSEPLEVVLITDSGQLGRDWADNLGLGRTLPTHNERLRESGTHKLTKDQLGGLGLKKEDLNYEALRDFCVMLNARHVVGDGMSVFSKMGDRCRGAGVRLVDFGL